MRDWLLSDEFAQRFAFRNDQEGTACALRVSLYLLERLALNPRFLPEPAAIGNGFIHLDYFGVSNPVPGFQLAPASPELATLLQAVQDNIASQRYRKALHTLHQREPRAVRRRENWVSRLVELKRSALDWPTAQDFRAQPQQARLRQDALVQSLVTEGKRVWAHRHARMAKLDPHQDLGSWTDLLYDIVRQEAAHEHEQPAEVDAITPRC